MRSPALHATLRRPTRYRLLLDYKEKVAKNDDNESEVGEQCAVHGVPVTFIECAIF